MVSNEPPSSFNFKESVAAELFISTAPNRVAVSGIKWVNIQGEKKRVHMRRIDPIFIKNRVSTLIYHSSNKKTRIHPRYHILLNINDNLLNELLQILNHHFVFKYTEDLFYKQAISFLAMFISIIAIPILSLGGALVWVVLCGRFSIAIRPVALKKRFDAELADSFSPRYNAAPGQDLPVILNRSPNQIQLCRWGFIPPWQKKAPTGARLINARAETIMEKRTFRRAFQKQRCLVLADGFYEWKKTPQRRIPYRFVLQDEAPFAFAGIWSQWAGADQRAVTSFSIITTDANAVVADVHDRMPVLLQPQDETSWLTMLPEDAVTLLKPFPADLMRAYPVSPRVNSPANDDPAVIKPMKRRKERVKRIDDFF